MPGVSVEVVTSKINSLHLTQYFIMKEVTGKGRACIVEASTKAYDFNKVCLKSRKKKNNP